MFDKITSKVLGKGEFQGIPYETKMIGMNLDGGNLIASSIRKKGSGSVPTDEEGVYDATATNSTKITLTEDDDSCIWAYEHDDATYTAIRKLVNLVNTDLIPVVEKKYEKNKAVLKGATFLEKNLTKKLGGRIDSIITYEYLNAFCCLKKLYNEEGKLVGCMELDPKECKPIRDLSTGELGGSTGKGLDNSRKTAEIALVQAGSIAKYDSNGNQTLTDQNFYFTREQIIPFSLNDRGKFKGVSPVMRVLRLVSFRRTVINIAEVVLRRFGPQIIVTVGNKDVNFEGNEIPAKYLRNTTTNQPVDRATAKAEYRKDVMNQVKTKITKWADTDTLVHLQEYGYSVETLNASKSLPDYLRYIDFLGKQIRDGILGTFNEGRVDITSGLMKETVSNDLRNIAEDVGKDVIWVFNKEFIEEWLRDNNLPEDSIVLEFAPIDKSIEQTDAIIERTKSEVIRNISSAGYEIPEEMLEKLGIKKLKKNPDAVKKDRTEQGTQAEPTPGQKPSGA